MIPEGILFGRRVGGHDPRLDVEPVLAALGGLKFHASPGKLKGRLPLGLTDGPLRLPRPRRDPSVVR